MKRIRDEPGFIYLIKQIKKTTNYILKGTNKMTLKEIIWKKIDEAVDNIIEEELDDLVEEAIAESGFYDEDEIKDEIRRNISSRIELLDDADYDLSREIDDKLDYALDELTAI